MEKITLTITLEEVIQVAKDSAPFDDKNKVVFENRLVELVVNLNVGIFDATVLTNDLSHDYVHENSAYST